MFYVLFLSVFFCCTSAQWDPYFQENRTTMVHLFEWKWKDIAEECVRFLGPFGYAGVQVSPPNENAPIFNSYNQRPWWERYQPVSYKLETRSGSELEFQNMVQICNNSGVRIYVDAVINHMTGQGLGNGTGGSFYDTLGRNYSDVPFYPEHFHNKTKCPTATGDIENYIDAIQVRNCKLSGLNDLDQSIPYVKQKIVEYINKLSSYGVAGVRIDASKHMWPSDLKSIVDSLDPLPISFGFPPNSKPFIFQEVIDLGGEPITSNEYTGHGRVTEFKYGANLGDVFRKLKGQKLAYLKNYGEGWAFLGSKNALAFVDNHDNQRGHGAGGASILTFRVSRLYKQAVAFMLAWPYGVTRVMSSYYWEQRLVNGKDANDWVGPPHDANYNTLDVVINKNFTCGNGWICEHRWREIYQMAKFRNIVGGTPVSNWWDNGNDQIAFSRGNKGFIAINNDVTDFARFLQTGMSAGIYCDIISGGILNGSCVGKKIVVDLRGYSFIYINNSEDSPIVAIHAQSKLI